MKPWLCRWLLTCSGSVIARRLFSGKKNSVQEVAGLRAGFLFLASERWAWHEREQVVKSRGAFEISRRFCVSSFQGLGGSAGGAGVCEREMAGGEDGEGNGAGTKNQQQQHRPGKKKGGPPPMNQAEPTILREGEADILLHGNDVFYNKAQVTFTTVSFMVSGNVLERRGVCVP